MAQTVKRLPAMQETWVRSLGWEDPLEKEMAAYSSTLAWEKKKKIYIYIYLSHCIVYLKHCKSTTLKVKSGVGGAGNKLLLTRISRLCFKLL